ncbi:hypothetical protein ACGF5T_32415 [Streptomyces sp. NPDC047853]|uniref:hypothetical protein n=1 Tax=unclassified Streptomyces TaxID=2593676 RepID=UPI00345174EF
MHAGIPGRAIRNTTSRGTTLRRYAAGEARPKLAARAAGQAWLADAGDWVVHGPALGTRHADEEITT